MTDYGYNGRISAEGDMTMVKRNGLAQAMRSPTIDEPASPDEIKRAFYGKVQGAPPPPMTQAQYHARRNMFRATNSSSPEPMSPETLAGVQKIIGASPARQERIAMAERAPKSVFIDGESFMPLGRPGYGDANRYQGKLPDQQVGIGSATSGMTTGGAIGSSLMRGGADSATTTASPNRNFEYKAGLGPMMPATGQGDVGQAVASDEAFQRQWAGMTGQTRGAALRSALAAQREAAANDPRIAENIARNEAAIARQSGGAPIVTDPAKRQEMWDREMARKELRRGGIPNAMAGMLANARNDPKTQGLLAAAMMGNPRAAQALGEMENSQMRDALAAAEARKLDAEAGALERYNPDALSPELQLQVQQTGEAARQAHLAANPGDEQGAILAAQQATGGRYVDVRTPQQINQAASSGKPETLPQPAGVPQDVIDRARESGDPEQIALADQMEEQNRRLEEARDAARRARTRTNWTTVLGLGFPAIGRGIRNLYDAMNQ